MNASNKKLGYFASATALVVGLGILSTSGCDQIKDACNLDCADTGVAEGNASISGNVAIDSFFQSVVNFRGVATGVAADISAELDGIQTAFGISNAEVTAKGSLGAALKAKLAADFKASIKVDAQPAKCEVDASFSAEANVECQAHANCEGTPPSASVECSGTCTVEASAEGKCEGMAEVSCEVSGPQLTCMGECSGTCTVEIMGTAKCDGACNGKCDGSTSNGASCAGMCEGTCEVGGTAAASCSGKCNGSCEYKAPMAGCEANAKVECKIKAEAKAQCSGKCDGEFTPPKVDCDAAASCEAHAKAEAKFQAKCTPPSINVRLTVDGSVQGSARAQLDYAVADLKARLPRLLAAVKKANLVVEAGTQLGKDGATAVQGTLSAFTKGKVDAVAAYRIGSCVPDQLTASAKVITDAGTDLKNEVTAAGSLTATLGM